MRFIGGLKGQLCILTLLSEYAILEEAHIKCVFLLSCVRYCEETIQHFFCARALRKIPKNVRKHCTLPNLGDAFDSFLGLVSLKLSRRPFYRYFHFPPPPQIQTLISTHDQKFNHVKVWATKCPLLLTKSWLFFYLQDASKTLQERKYVFLFLLFLLLFRKRISHLSVDLTVENRGHEKTFQGRNVFSLVGPTDFMFPA
jgi:hypothetical protein